MFLKRINVRVTLVFAAVFITTSVLSFAILVFALNARLSGDEQEFLNHKLLAYWALFRTAGGEAVPEDTLVATFLGEDRPFFLRVSDQENRTIFMAAPQAWSNIAYEALSARDRVNGEFFTIPAGDRGYLLLIKGIGIEDGRFLHVGMSSERREAFLSAVGRTFLFVFIPLFALAAAAGYISSTALLRPLRSVIRAVRDLAATGDLSARVDEHRSPDELGELTGLFNDMLGRIERLVRGMRDSLDTVAHDIRTPMTRLRAQAELALRDSADRTSALEGVVEESERILSMLTTILDIAEVEAGARPPAGGPIDLAQIIGEAIELYRFVGEERHIEILYHGPRELRIAGDAARLRRAAANLLDNAVKYSPRGSSVMVSLGEKDGHAFFSVADEGPGIRAEEIERIWDRLYRSPSVRGLPGLGLGLSLVKAVANAHGGSVEAVNRSPGACFTVRLPLGGPASLLTKM